MAKHHNIVDVEVLYIVETEKAVLVKTDDDATSVWLPFSVIEMRPGKSHNTVIISLPEPFAVEKGLV